MSQRVFTSGAQILLQTIEADNPLSTADRRFNGENPPFHPIQRVPLSAPQAIHDRPTSQTIEQAAKTTDSICVADSSALVCMSLPRGSGLLSPHGTPRHTVGVGNCQAKSLCRWPRVAIEAMSPTPSCVVLDQAAECGKLTGHWDGGLIFLIAPAAIASRTAQLKIANARSLRRELTPFSPTR